MAVMVDLVFLGVMALLPILAAAWQARGKNAGI